MQIKCVFQEISKFSQAKNLKHTYFWADLPSFCLFMCIFYELVKRSLIYEYIFNLVIEWVKVFRTSVHSAWGMPMQEGFVVPLQAIT